MPDKSRAVVKTFQSKDQAERVLIIRRPDGLYSIGLERWRPAFEQAPAPPIPAYWAPAYERSGVYASIEIAEREACSLYPWLRRENADS
jgi:hypothetical protein